MDWSFVKAQYGNIASVLGLVISIAGFILMLREVRKSRTAAEQAQQLAQEAISRVSFRLFFTQIATAVRLAMELRSACRTKLWHQAIDRSEQLRILLADLVEDAKLDSTEPDFVTGAIDDLSLVMGYVEEIVQEKKSPLLLARMMKALSNIDITLSRINGRLKSQILEVQHGR